MTFVINTWNLQTYSWDFEIIWKYNFTSNNLICEKWCIRNWTLPPITMSAPSKYCRVASWQIFSHKKSKTKRDKHKKISPHQTVDIPWARKVCKTSRYLIQLQRANEVSLPLYHHNDKVVTQSFRHEDQYSIFSSLFMKRKKIERNGLVKARAKS